MQFQFDVYSLIFALIILGYAFIGLKKGFTYMFLYLVMPVILFVIALVAAQPVANLLIGNTPFGEMAYNFIYQNIMGLSTYFAEENPGRDILASVLAGGNFEAVTQMGIPGFIAPIFTALILASVPVAADSILIGQYVSIGATFALFYLISLLVLYSVMNVILTIVRKIIVKARKKAKQRAEENPKPKKENPKRVKPQTTNPRVEKPKKIKPQKPKRPKKHGVISRLLGMTMGIAIGCLSSLIIGYVLQLLFLSDPSLHSFLDAIWLIDDPTVMTIGKWIVLENPLKVWLLKLFQTFKF